jgi:YHS domain-containing protein
MLIDRRRDTAVKTADQMEYQGQGWLNPDANQVYAKAPISTEEHPLCPVCDMDADKKVAKSVYQGKTYYFCMPGHKALFDKTPEKYLSKWLLRLPLSGCIPRNGALSAGSLIAKCSQSLLCSFKKGNWYMVLLACGAGFALK